jgi:transglutaminase-like putative cysteine protease
MHNSSFFLSELPVRYRICHDTRYDYDEATLLCHNQLLLAPRVVETAFYRQNVVESAVRITPTPDDERVYADYFGNEARYFELRRPHMVLQISATSLVEREETDLGREDFGERGVPASLAWEDVARADAWEAAPFRWESSFVRIFPELRGYAEKVFTPNRPLLDAAMDLTRQIYADFRFMPGFTTISTPLEEVFREKKGVCQDFAHIALGCLRALGLPARYASGYIETIPPEGAERLQGADASHAWIAVFEPHWGWVEFDPTNNQRVGNRHVLLAWGRDYSDVAPLKGVVVGGGGSRLTVGVDMTRLTEALYIKKG